MLAEGRPSRPRLTPLLVVAWLLLLTAGCSDSARVEVRIGVNPGGDPIQGDSAGLDGFGESAPDESAAEDPAAGDPGSPVLPAVATAIPALRIDTASYQLVSSQRVNRTVFEYTYRVNVVNEGTAAPNVRAVVTSGSAATVITDGEVSFGDVAAGGTVSSSDTFTLRQDRTVPFNPAQLSWALAFDNPPGTTVATIRVSRSWIFLTAPGQTGQLTATALDSAGNPLSALVTWSSSAPEQISVDAAGRVTGLVVGSAQIFAEVDGVKSLPTLVAVAVPKPGTILVTDAQVLSVTPPAIQDPEGETEYEVALTGVETPALGALMLAAETSLVAGRVTATRQEASGVVVTLRLVPIYELLADWNIDWRIDLSPYPLVDAPGSATGFAQTSRFSPQAPDFISTFLCRGSIVGQLASATVSLTPVNRLELISTTRPGFSLVALAGSATLEGTASVGLKPTLRGTVTCEAFKSLVIPAFGWVSIFVAPGVRLGVGAELDGQVIAVEALVGGEGSVGFESLIGWQCTNDTCGAIENLSPVNRFKPKHVVPTANGMRVELSGWLYALAGLDLAFFAGASSAEILDIRLGPKQSFDLAFEEDQLLREDYASKYALTLDLVAQPGASLKKAVRLLSPGPGIDVKFRAKESSDLSVSPKGTLEASRSNVPLGETVNLTVRLDPPTTDYFLLDYNVESVELYRRRVEPGQEPTDWTPFRTLLPNTNTGGVTATRDTFTYQWEPAAADAGDNEFAAMVNTVLPTPDLEINPRSIAKVRVSCFGAQAAASGSFGAQAVTCADTWNGFSRLDVKDGYRADASNITWVRKPPPPPEPGGEPPVTDPTVVEYYATGAVTIDYTVFTQQGCDVSPSTFTLGNDGSNFLVVDYGTNPATFIVSGTVSDTFSITCPNGFVLETPLNFNWVNGSGPLKENGAVIEDSNTSEFGSFAYRFVRP